MFTLKNNFKILSFVLFISCLNFLFFHIPFFNFVFENINYKSFSGVFVIASLVVLMIVLNAFVFFLLLYLSQRIGKFLLVLFFLMNAIAVYFVATYGIIVDESMIGNVFNTNYDESSSYFSYKMVLYLLFLGVLPSYFILRSKVERISFKRFSILSSLTLLFALVLVFVNASNWLWIDKNSKRLGGLAMPWSYVVNTSLFYIHESKKNEKEILLPDAKIKDNEKAVVVLVIGESARRQNFSLYGYSKNTNPLLSKTQNLFHFDANSSATYT
ncbi:MAG: phosphoethanolamine transferase domain-containing protein, partial [Flavobacterium sp.]|nr:phosphoethanolamine transferase domain-containing protein [Flavobacterium sp.]